MDLEVLMTWNNLIAILILKYNNEIGKQDQQEKAALKTR